VSSRDDLHFIRGRAKPRREGYWRGVAPAGSISASSLGCGISAESNRAHPCPAFGPCRDYRHRL